VIKIDYTEISSDATSASSSNGVMDFINSPVISVLIIILIIVAIAGLWRMLEKADRPGWHALVPLLNIWDFVDISGMNPIVAIPGMIGVFLIVAGGAMLNVSEASVMADGMGSAGGIMMLISYPLLIIHEIVRIICGFRVCTKFGYDIRFGILALFLPSVMYAILGFSDAEYMADGYYR